MKVSIWQQFSSNNSSRFTVVGQFESVEQAEFAREEIIRLLSGIVHFYDQAENREQRRKLFPPNSLVGEPLTPIEIEFSEKYEIEWKEPINWAVHNDGFHETVEIIDNLVFVSSGYPQKDTFQSPYPITVLLEKLGAYVGSDHIKEHKAAKAKIEIRGTEAQVSQLLKQIETASNEGRILKLSDRNLSVYIESIEYKKATLTLNGLSIRSLADVVRFLKLASFEITSCIIIPLE